MRKLDQLCKTLIGELKWRSEACTKYLETEQKILNDDHHMYPEHFELLPWVMSQLPIDLHPQRVEP